MKTKIKIIFIFFYGIFVQLQSVEIDIQTDPIQINVTDAQTETDLNMHDIERLVQTQVPHAAEADVQTIARSFTNLQTDNSIQAQKLTRAINKYESEPTEMNRASLIKRMLKSKKSYVKASLQSMFTIMFGAGGSYLYHQIRSNRLTRSISIEGLSQQGFDWIGLFKTGAILSAGITVAIVLISIWIKIKRFIFDENISELNNAREYYQKTRAELVLTQRAIEGFKVKTEELREKLNHQIIPLLGDRILPCCEALEDSSQRSLAMLSGLEKRVELIEKINETKLKSLVQETEKKLRRDQEAAAKLEQKITARSTLLGRQPAAAAKM